MKKGFTLLEILIVVIIIAILATFGIPQYIKASRKAIASEAISTIGSLRGGIARYYQENNAMPTSGAIIDLDIVGSATGVTNLTKNFGFTWVGADPENLTITATGELSTRGANFVITHDGSSITITYDGVLLQ